MKTQNLYRAETENGDVIFTEALSEDMARWMNKDRKIKSLRLATADEYVAHGYILYRQKGDAK